MNQRIEKAYERLKSSLSERFQDSCVDISDEHLDKLTTHLVIEALAKADKPYNNSGLIMLCEDIGGRAIDEDLEPAAQFSVLKDL